MPLFFSFFITVAHTSLPAASPPTFFRGWNDDVPTKERALTRHSNPAFTVNVILNEFSYDLEIKTNLPGLEFFFPDQDLFFNLLKFRVLIFLIFFYIFYYFFF